MKLRMSLEGSRWSQQWRMSSTLSKNFPTWKPRPQRSFSESCSGSSSLANQRREEVPEPDELVPDLLLLGLELHFVGERLPFAAAAEPEMLAERLEAVLGGFLEADDEALHVVGLFLGDAYVYDIARDSRTDENHCTLVMGEGVAFCRDGFYGDVLQDEVKLFSSHKSLM